MERQSLPQSWACQCFGLLWSVTWQNYSSEACKLGNMSNRCQARHCNQGNLQLWLHRWYIYEFIMTSLFTIIVKQIFCTIHLVSFNSTRNHWRSPSISSIRHLELWCSPLCSFVRTTSIQGWKCRREQGQYFERKVQVWMALQGSDYGSNSIAHVDL